MGGGVAMRVAPKIAGVVNGGGFPAFPENITSAAFKASATRPITGVVSETQFDAASSVVNSCDVGQPLPRLVFSGAPTLEEAQDATFQLTIALDQAYLSNVSNEGSCEADMGHDKLALSDSGYLESKTCVTKASAPNLAFKAFRLLKESAAVQNVVASIASDPNVLAAVMKNEAVLKFFRSQFTGLNGSLEKSIAYTEIPGHAYTEIPGHAYPEIPGYESANYSNDEKERKNWFDSFFEDIKSRVEDMMNSLSSFFQNLFDSLSSFFQDLFAGPPGAGGSGRDEKTFGAYIMDIIGLAVMVIMIVVFKRVV